MSDRIYQADRGNDNQLQPRPLSARMGIYKRLDDLPESRQLNRFEPLYSGRDIWGTYLIEAYLTNSPSERFVANVRAAGRNWGVHCEEIGHHHALASPSSVEIWSENLCENLTLNVAYNNYWVKIERFYTYLLEHIDHPHCYNPFLIAADTRPAAGRIWQTKIERGATNE